MTQGSKPGVQADSLPSEPLGKPRQKMTELLAQITIVSLALPKGPQREEGL